MAKRKAKKRRPILLAAALILLSVLLTADLIAARVYIRHTGEDFFTALGRTTRLGGQYLINLLSPADRSVPVNPYRATDYYRSGDFIQCAESEVSRTGIDVSSHQKEIDWQQTGTTEEEARKVNAVKEFPAGVGRKPQEIL